jgi:hypothetical protein
MQTHMLQEDVGLKEKQNSYPEQIIKTIELFNLHEISKGRINSFEDDGWDLTVLDRTSKSQGKGYYAVKFDSYQEWSKPFCKAFIAHLLFKKYSPCTLVRNKRELNVFFLFIRDYKSEIKSIYQIKQSDMQGYIEFLISLDKSENFKQRRYAVVEFFLVG